MSDYEEGDLYEMSDREYLEYQVDKLMKYSNPTYGTFTTNSFPVGNLRNIIKSIDGWKLEYDGEYDSHDTTFYVETRGKRFTLSYSKSYNDDSVRFSVEFK